MQHQSSDCCWEAQAGVKLVSGLGDLFVSMQIILGRTGKILEGSLLLLLSKKIAVSAQLEQFHHCCHRLSQLLSLGYYGNHGSVN